MSNLTHNAAIDALCKCAASVSVLSYQEAIEGYFKLRGLAVPNQQPAQDGLVEALDDATIDEIILNFAGGIVQVPSKHNPRGYVSYYRPRDAMRNALSAIKGDKS